MSIPPPACPDMYLARIISTLPAPKPRGPDSMICTFIDGRISRRKLESHQTWEKLIRYYRRLHYAAGEVRNYTLYFPLHRIMVGTTLLYFARLFA